MGRANNAGRSVVMSDSRKAAVRPFRGPPLSGFFDEMVDSCFPFAHLVLASASKGEKLEIIVSLPPHLEGKIGWKTNCCGAIVSFVQQEKR